jgi:hypothetical protein
MYVEIQASIDRGLRHVAAGEARLAKVEGMFREARARAKITTAQKMEELRRELRELSR